MGPAVVASGIVWGLALREAERDQSEVNDRGPRAHRETSVFSVALGGPARLVAAAGLACACAMVTPIVRAAAAVDALPIWWQCT
jgi:hypothetical protein